MTHRVRVCVRVSPSQRKDDDGGGFLEFSTRITGVLTHPVGPLEGFALAWSRVSVHSWLWAGEEAMAFNRLWRTKEKENEERRGTCARCSHRYQHH